MNVDLVVKPRVLRWVSLLSASLLVACTSSTGPVVIRDATTHGAVDASHAKQNAVLIKASPEPNTVQPVLPQKVPQPTSLQAPLKDKLLKQSRQQLSLGQANNSIRLAEKGLRVDRKEAGFYVVLAEAYQSLGDNEQSKQFAIQGLRYAPRNSIYFQQLKELSR